jgi:4-amino-4-deoxy-L-arabinose transferase-like glycosyltransferase
MNKIFQNERWYYLFLLVLVCIPLFQHLGALPIRLWDESRLAINAYEMYHSGNYITTTFNGAPDMWNTKPPLMIWCQVFFMKLFGVNEWAIRLPSALAALFTCVVIMLISVRYVKNFWFGFICVLVLVTSRGYVGPHATRTGDYDALLTFFITLGSFSFFIFLENLKAKYLYLFFFSMGLAVLTKSSAALLILPGLFVYTAFKKKIIFLLKNKHFYVGLLLFLICAGAFYLLREMSNLGYVNAVITNEFGRRFLDTLESHKQSFWFYLINLFDHRFIIWAFFLPFGIIIGLRSKDDRIKSVTIFSVITALSYFLIISSAQTKLSWYVVPMYPVLSILVAVSIFHIFSRLKEKEKLKYKALPYIFLCVVFIFPYSQIVYKTYQKKGYIQNEEMYGSSYYLRDLLYGKIQNDDFSIIYDDVFTHGQFYLLQLLEQGKNISLKESNRIEIGEIVFISQFEVKKFVEENYDYNLVGMYCNSVFYEIVGEKK